MKSSGRRIFDYLGLRLDTEPSRRGWMVRVSNPAYATSRRDRWIGSAIFALLATAAISLMFRGQWQWYVVGAFDLLIAVPNLTRCLWSIARRSPLAGSPQQRQQPAH